MNANVTECTKVRGFWTAKAHGPLLVSDPEKARRLLGLKPVVVPRNSVLVLPVSFIDRKLPELKAGLRRELLRLLTGGTLKWKDAWENIVVNQGLNDLLDVTLSGATQDTTWFIGLLSATPTIAAADTLASHAGWTEVTAYDEVNRIAFVDAGASSQSLSNAASPAVFTINANGTTLGGSFLAGVSSGTSGRLYAAGAYSAGNKDLDDNDTLSVTATFTMQAA